MSDSRLGIAFVGECILLREAEGRVRLPTRKELSENLGEDLLELTVVPAAIQDCGSARACAFALDDGFEVPEGYRLEGLRVAYHGLSTEEFRAAGTARQKVEWYRTHKFCSRCGSINELDKLHEALACTKCGQLHFPRVAPAVIVLVQRGHEVLLGRSPHFEAGVYSTLAGFVEAGESLEECVHREIKEEVGIQVENLRYFGSQPHPFPNSLMVGFVADWQAGEIHIDPVEIEDARWFTVDDLPKIPHPMSIARSLIKDFVRRTST